MSTLASSSAGLDVRSERSYVGFWLRTLACLIDMLVFVLIFAAVLAVVPTGELIPVRERYVTANIPSNVGWGPMLAVLYTVGFWAFAGATPGKMLLGMRIVSASTGATIGLGRAILRYLGTFVSGLFLGIGFLWIGIDRRKQGWHDKIAGTVVVSRRG